MLREYVQIGGADESRPTAKEVEMEKAKEITPTEEIMVTTEEIVTKAKDEVKEAPSRMHKKTAPIDSRMEGCQRAVERLRIGCYGL